MDVDKDFPNIEGLKESLQQYYDIKQTTDLWSFNTGRVQAKMGVNEKPFSGKPNFPDMIYPINYGYVDGVFAADGEEQDVYIFGANEPLKTYTGKVIAVYHRTNDTEDKWIVSVDGKDYSDEKILERIEFQEKYFEGTLLRK